MCGGSYLNKFKSINKNYFIILFFSVFIPVDEIVLALGGIAILLTTYLIILKATRKKKSQNKLEKRFTGIKSQFNDIKDKSVSYSDDDWLEMRLKEDSDKYKSQLGMNKR